jgi:hypothetical protein
LAALQFICQDGKPLASPLDFPCHPDVLWELAFRRKPLPDVRYSAGRIDTEVCLLKIGRRALPGFPAMLPKLGLALRASLGAAGGETAVVIGLADDEMGCILPEEDFRYPLNLFRPRKQNDETNAMGKEIGVAVGGRPVR